MLDVIKKISFLPLILSLMISLSGCWNDNVVDDSMTFFNDFEKEDVSIWKNVCIEEDVDACSGSHVCVCPSDRIYAFGFNLNVEENANALITIDMMVKADSKPNSVFVVSVKKEDKTIFWKSFPLSNGFVAEKQWYNNKLPLSLPNDVIKNSSLNCYVLNDKGETLFIDDFRFNLKYFNVPTYLDEIEQYDLPKDLKNVFDTKSVNILYSKKRKQIVLADENDKPITTPLSLFYSLIIDNDTVDFQISEFKNLKTSEAHKLRISETQKSELGVQIVVSEENDSNVKFNLETTYSKDVRVLRSSLIIPFLNDDFTVYRRNPFVDTCDFQSVYYLDKEGFSVFCHDKQLNLYHPDDVSSIQLDVENTTAYINMDYYYDHILMRYELMDTADYYVDNSSAFMKEGSACKSSFVLSMTDKVDLPRLMPVYDGYESAFIWTEHADWADVKTHRATYFGNEYIVDIDDATGGFAFYDIPVTKSVFYHNPDSVTNFEKNPEFPGLHSTIKTDSSFFDFLKQLKDKGFDICLHTPEQYTSTRDYIAEALSFMKDNFSSPTWIDHGYNNGAENNREDMMCDGLDSLSPYYVYDLWKEYNVMFPFNATYEEMSPRPFVDYVFDNELLRPYPGFGDALPLPKVMRHPSYPDVLQWTTHYTIEPGKSWDYYLSQERIDKILDFRYVFITHFYAPWVDANRGFWEVKDGKYVAKEGLDKTLKRLSEMRDDRLMLPTTIADYMTYQKQLANLQYRVDDDGSVILKNNNNETIKGLSLISVREMSLDDEKCFNEKKTHDGDEWIIWFDIEPEEVVRVLNVNKK